MISPPFVCMRMPSTVPPSESPAANAVVQSIPAIKQMVKKIAKIFFIDNFLFIPFRLLCAFYFALRSYYITPSVTKVLQNIKDARCSRASFALAFLFYSAAVSDSPSTPLSS